MADATVAYAVLAGLIAIIIGAIYYLQAVHKKEEAAAAAQEEQEALIQQAAAGGNRAAANRNVRARLRARLAERQGVDVPPEEHAQPVVAGAAAGDDDHSFDDEEEGEDGPVMSNSKKAKKMAAKQQAKAEKKALREQEVRAREEKKAREEEVREEKRKKEEEEEAEQKRLEEEERKLQEEKEKKELEEYEKMKSMFSVVDSGFDASMDENAEKDLLKEFVEHIKKEKVVVLEELAARFRLRTQAVIARIDDLLASGTLSGVMDDRGKFIYISTEEMEAVAKFVRQRGRVTISELVEESGNLISLAA